MIILWNIIISICDRHVSLICPPGELSDCEHFSWPEEDDDYKKLLSLIVQKLLPIIAKMAVHLNYLQDENKISIHNSSLYSWPIDRMWRGEGGREGGTGGQFVRVSTCVSLTSQGTLFREYLWSLPSVSIGAVRGTEVNGLRADTNVFVHR